MTGINVEEIMKAVDFTASEINSVKKGELVKGVLDSLSERELAVKFAFTIKKVEMEKIEQAFMESHFKNDDPSVFEVGHLVGADDSNLFAGLKLEPGADAAVKLYLKAAPGDDLNLSAEEIEEFHKLGKKATRDAVESLIQTQLTRRYKAYRELGMRGIAPYQRSKSKSYNPGEELEHKTAKMEILKKHIPEVHKYLLEYPQAPKPDGLKESFSWTVSVFEDLPMIALVHKVGYVHPTEGCFYFFQRMFYVSRPHNSVQGTGGCFVTEDDPDHYIVLYACRTSTDKVTGFGGAAKRALGARIMSSKQSENFIQLREKLKDFK